MAVTDVFHPHYGEVLARIATALEVLVAERTRPKNTKRIRVEFMGVYDGSPRVARFRVAGVARVALGDCVEIPGPQKLWRVDSSDLKVIDVGAADLRYEIEVPLIAVYDSKKPFDGMPESKVGRQQYLVTVDLQPDPATWGWREWVRL